VEDSGETMITMSSILMQEVASVYALLDPRTLQIKYVGSTKQQVLMRTSQKKKYSGELVSEWVEQLYKENLYPITALLEVVDCKVRNEAESKWIRYTLSLGCDLLNTSDPCGDWRSQPQNKINIKRRLELKRKREAFLDEYAIAHPELTTRYTVMESIAKESETAAPIPIEEVRI
jgi:hypothetical protein